jgi:hypothetical protein
MKVKFLHFYDPKTTGAQPYVMGYHRKIIKKICIAFLLGSIPFINVHFLHIITRSSMVCGFGVGGISNPDPQLSTSNENSVAVTGHFFITPLYLLIALYTTVNVGCLSVNYVLYMAKAPNQVDKEMATNMVFGFSFSYHLFDEQIKRVNHINGNDV